VSGDRHERFRRDYAPVFLQYLSERGEPGLRTAYELGRRAMAEKMSMLDLVGVHHAVLLDVLRTLKRPEELEDVSQAASEFFVEVLATYEMVQRVMAPPRRGH
jgi:Phosphoserine phosphatase RsbU, N-terminal domain